MVIERVRNLRKVLGAGVRSRILFSLFLAFLLWGWVTNLDDPEVDRTFPNQPIAVQGRAADLVLQDESTLSSATVVLRGPESTFGDVSASNIKVTINLSEITAPGQYQVDVNVTLNNQPRGVRVASNSPERVTITLDRLISKTFQLEVDPGSAVPPYSIGNVDTQTRQVEVRGPSTQVERIARVALPVGLGDRRENFEAQFTPEARDVNGTRVPGVTVTPNSVTATVTVQRVGRTVSIVPNIVGDPPAGFRVSNTRVSPPSVTVDGPADLLTQLIVVSTTPIELNARRETFSVFDVGLQLPPGTRLVETTPINVEVTIEAEQQRQQVNVRVTTLTDPGLRATVNPQEIVVVLSGSRERLSQLRSDDIKAELDLRGYTVGTYFLAPRITVPSDLRYDPATTVRVQIDRPATPTSTPTITPTPAPTPTPTAPLPTPTPSARTDDSPIAARRTRVVGAFN